MIWPDQPETDSNALHIRGWVPSAMPMTIPVTSGAHLGIAHPKLAQMVKRNKLRYGPTGQGLTTPPLHIRGWVPSITQIGDWAEPCGYSSSVPSGVVW